MVALPDRVTKYRTKRGKIAAARHLLRGEESNIVDYKITE